MDKIWATGSGRFIDKDELVKRLAAADHVMLGERHDNRAHHDNQAWIIAHLLEFARRPVIAMEMLTPDDEEIVATYLSERPRDAAGLGKALGWSARGWPAWENYQSIADVALANRLTLASAALSEHETEILRSNPDGAEGEWLLRRLDIDGPLDRRDYDAIAKEIRESHCGYAPESIVPSMVLVQRARDSRMAESMVRADAGRGTVLIAGNGHVRTDRGAPAYLHRRDESSSVAALAFVEVRGSSTSPRDYAAAFGTQRMPFDYVWFTKAVERPDPCEEFREVLEGLGRRGSE